VPLSHHLPCKGRLTLGIIIFDDNLGYLWNNPISPLAPLAAASGRKFGLGTNYKEHS
jgi:hypothetical protein